MPPMLPRGVDNLFVRMDLPRSILLQDMLIAKYLKNMGQVLMLTTCNYLQKHSNYESTDEREGVGYLTTIDGTYTRNNAAQYTCIQ